MRILATGGAGFIGSAVCRLMAGDGFDVLNLDALTYAGNLSSLAEVEGRANYRFVQGDICDRPLAARLLADFSPDAIVHLAAESHVDRSIEGSADFIRTNVVGTHTLLSAALEYWEALPPHRRRTFRFLHVSTDEVFGSLGADGAFDEASAYDPRSPYSASKAASDHLVRAWGTTYGLPIIVTNCSNNYGPYQFPEKLIPLATLNALEGRAISVYGDGGHVRDWLHVEDHARALKAALERGRVGETYLVGGRSERRNLDVVHSVCDILDELAPDPAIGPRRGLVELVADRPGHDRRYAVECGKIERELGWRAQHDFESGLRGAVAWYLARRDWWAPIRARYAGERLGLKVR
ncbi:MAG: dTDP-glucose 4,6-dehydratase [Hyphomonadaceae bacterium]|nr:dTDP-glucose 4,6-dehydratase [Hyphomonadaceae bacterium]